jgi:hypothetical protein
MNPKVARFIDELKLAKRPFLTTDTQVLSGRAILTVWPDVESEVFTKARIEIPKAFQLDEFPCFLLFILSMFDASCIMQLQPQINALFKHDKPYAAKVEGLIFRVFAEEENFVMTLESRPQEQSRKA